MRVLTGYLVQLTFYYFLYQSSVKWLKLTIIIVSTLIDYFGIIWCCRYHFGAVQCNIMVAWWINDSKIFF